MKIGDTVLYVDKDGRANAATLTSVDDSGPSGFKVVSVAFAKVSISRVPHKHDAGPNSGYWMEIGEPEPEPDLAVGPAAEPVAPLNKKARKARR